MWTDIVLSIDLTENNFKMAVPKRKVTPSRKKMRSANKGLKAVNISFDKTTGEPKLSHHMSLKDCMYNERQVKKTKVQAVVPTE